MMTMIEKFDSKDCARQLQEAEERLAAVQARLGEIRPSPSEARFDAVRAPMPKLGPTPIGAPAYDSLAGAGPEYRRVVLEGMPEELAALERERQTLAAELRQLSHRRRVLRERKKVATEEEAQAAAPATAEKLMKRLPEVLDHVDAALAELASALEERDTVLRELDAARKLTGGEPYFAPEHLRRVWASDTRPVTASVLRGLLSTRTEALPFMVDSLGGGRMPHPQRVRDAAEKLAPVDQGIVARLRKRIVSTLNPYGAGEGPHPDSKIAEELAVVRARLIAEGSLERLQDAEGIAREAIKDRYRGPGRKPPSDAQVDSWLRPRR